MFCQHCVYVFAWEKEKSAIIYLHNINASVFITVEKHFYSAVRTGFLNQTATVSSINFKYIPHVFCQSIFHSMSTSITSSWPDTQCINTNKQTHTHTHTHTHIYIYIYIYIYNVQCLSTKADRVPDSYNKKLTAITLIAWLNAPHVAAHVRK